MTVMTPFHAATAASIIANAGVRLFFCPLDDDGGQPLAEAAALLCQTETARAARFHFARDRDRFVRGRAFLRKVLGVETGEAPAAIRFVDGPRGKPALNGGHSPHFNLSHSGGMMVLALSDLGPVGVDIEWQDRRLDAQALGRTVFVGAEYAVLAGLSGLALTTRFLSFWTAKEARMKLTGEGMSLPPKAIELALTEDGWPCGYLRPAVPAARLIPLGPEVPGLPAGLIGSIALDAAEVG
jgi:4'-phosphopantetheinyl transferase